MDNGIYKIKSSQTKNWDKGNAITHVQNQETPYTDSYADYVQWTPELYEKYGLPQNYNQPDLPRKPLRKQDISSVMQDMFGTEAAVRISNYY